MMIKQQLSSRKKKEKMLYFFYFFWLAVDQIPYADFIQKTQLVTQNIFPELTLKLTKTRKNKPGWNRPAKPIDRANGELSKTTINYVSVVAYHQRERFRSGVSETSTSPNLKATSRSHVVSALNIDVTIKRSRRSWLWKHQNCWNQEHFGIFWKIWLIWWKNIIIIISLIFTNKVLFKKILNLKCSNFWKPCPTLRADRMGHISLLKLLD